MMLTLDDPKSTLETVRRVHEDAEYLYTELLDKRYPEPALSDAEDYLDHLREMKEVAKEELDALRKDASEKEAEEKRYEVARYGMRVKRYRRAIARLRRYGLKETRLLENMKRVAANDRRRLEGYIKAQS